MTKPQEHEYSSHVAYTRALEAYCKVIESQNSKIVCITDKAKIAELERQVAEQAAQIEMLREALNEVLALPTNKDIWKYRVDHHQVISEVTDYYSDIASVALSITPSQALQDYTDKVLEKAVPEGYALIAIDVLKAWGKYDEIKAACIYPIAAVRSMK